MELASQTLSDKTNTVIIVPVMDKGIKFLPPVKPCFSRHQQKSGCLEFPWISASNLNSGCLELPGNVI